MNQHHTAQSVKSAFRQFIQLALQLPGRLHVLLLGLFVAGQAFAATAPPAAPAANGITTALQAPANQICSTLTAVTTSPIVGVAAIGMVVLGIVLIATKSRGGPGWIGFGVVGFFLVRQSVAIAKSFGLVGCV